MNRTHLQAVARGPQQPFVEELTTHYTELPEAKPDSPLFREWNTYRQEVGRLLSEGNAGWHILIKDERIIGMWPTHDEAMTIGFQRFLGQPFLVHEIQERERVWHCVTDRSWHNFLSHFRRAS